VSHFQVALNTVLIIALLPSYAAAQGMAAPALTTPPEVPTSSTDVRGTVAAGHPSWRQDFEGPATSWVEAGGDAQYSLVAHQRVRGGAHSGQGSEWFQVVGQGGSTVLIAHDIGRPWVIDELRPSVWIFADRPGTQFFAEVTLPRTRDPRTARPLTANIFGTAYTTVGRWQRLEIADFPRALARQLRVMRSQLAMNVDGREAFVSRVLLNIYGGAGVTNVWTDDLEVFGHVPSVMNAAGPIGQAGSATAASPIGLSGSNPDAGAVVAGRPVPPQREVKLALSVLTINEHPIFPRSIEYRGEKLDFLKRLGFNTIWLRQTPSPAFLSEARQLGLWLVCPPPEMATAASGGDPSSAGQNGTEANPPFTIGPEFEPVLAWDMGHGLTGESLDANRQRADRVGLADARFSRPLIGAAINNLRSYSRFLKPLLIDRRPLGTSLEMPNYGNWVLRQPLLALPGTPVWTTVQTQAGEGLRRQFAALTPGQAPPTVVGSEQVRLLVYTAIASGSRGLLFLSDSSLEAQDGETRQRVITLQLLNQELRVIEPWVAGGSMVDTAKNSQNPVTVTGAILRDDRARIVMPKWLAPGSQCVAPLAAANPLNLTLSGIPESDNVFELTAGPLQPLRHRRVAGGTQVTLDEFGLSSLLFLAQDPAIIEEVNRWAKAGGEQTAKLELYLARQKYDTVARVLAQIGGRTPPRRAPAIDFDAARQYARLSEEAAKREAETTKDFKTARENLELCEARMSTGDFAMASIYARRAMMPLRKLERAAWDTAKIGRDSPVAIPGLSSFAALPWYWALVDRIEAMHPGANRLPGGDFENLEMMIRYGWRYTQHDTPGIQPYVDLVPDAAHSGLLGLRLTVRTDNPENPPAIIEVPPITIMSPAIPVEAGQIVRIHGWVNVPAAIIGSVDGLLVIDSLTGEEMALRLDRTIGWQEFTMLRIVPQSGPLTLTLAMTGIGEVRLDDLTIEVLQ